MRWLLGLASAIAFVAGCAESTDDGDGESPALQVQEHNVAFHAWGAPPENRPERQDFAGQFPFQGDGAGEEIVSAYRDRGQLYTCRFSELGTWFCSNLPATIHNSGSSEQRFLAGDVNGDAKLDMLQVYRGWGSIPMCSLTVNGWECSNPAATIYNSGSWEQQFHSGDFNGDGLTDVFQTYRGWGAIPTCTASGTGTWNCSVQPASLYNSGSFKQSFLSGDFDGDARTDFVQLYEGWTTIPTCRSTGASWSCTNATSNHTRFVKSQWFAVDFDGDGDDELVTSSINLGSGIDVCNLTGPQSWSCERLSFHPGDATPDQNVNRFSSGDFDGDGDDDLAYVMVDGTVVTCPGRPSGTAGTCAPLWSPPGIALDHTNLTTVADIDGDGSDEMIIGANEVCELDASAIWRCSWPVTNAYDLNRGRFISIAETGGHLRHSCVDAFVSTQHCDASGNCIELKRTPCWPYACAEGIGCKDTCASNADCAPSGVCDTALSRCGQPTWACKDSFTAKDEGGFETSCAPYKCEGGACNDRCATTSDCADHHWCRAQRCTPLCYHESDCVYLYGDDYICNASGQCEREASANECASDADCNALYGVDYYCDWGACRSYVNEAVCSNHEDCMPSWHCNFFNSQCERDY